MYVLYSICAKKEMRQRKEGEEREKVRMAELQELQLYALFLPQQNSYYTFCLILQRDASFMPVQTCTEWKIPQSS
jgi:hypothetical protein